MEKDYNPQYNDLKHHQVDEIRSLRDGAINYALERKFKDSLEALEDLKAWMIRRQIHPSFFKNILNEVIAAVEALSTDPLLILDFQQYYIRHWRR